MSLEKFIVLVKYKAQPGKATDAIAALKSLITEVAKEPHYIHIELLTDAVDEGNILLYETWASETYYKGDHMNTPHLQQFMGEARSFLSGPPDISFWKPPSL